MLTFVMVQDAPQRPATVHACRDDKVPAWVGRDDRRMVDGGRIAQRFFTRELAEYGRLGAVLSGPQSDT